MQKILINRTRLLKWNQIDYRIASYGGWNYMEIGASSNGESILYFIWKGEGKNMQGHSMLVSSGDKDHDSTVQNAIKNLNIASNR